MRTTLIGALCAPLLARAHEGHGLAPGHWHATDAFGFGLALAVLVAVVLWRNR